MFNIQILKSKTIKRLRSLLKILEKIVHDTLSYNERETKIKIKSVKNREKILEKQNLVNKRNLLSKIH